MTHTEPLVIASALATLDRVSAGRAGWRVLASGRSNEAAHFGRRVFAEVGTVDLADPAMLRAMAERFEEAAEYVEVVRRLWDSNDDGRMHPIDYNGRWFEVDGPATTPRPP